MTYTLDTIVAWAKRRGFAYPGSEIYGGLANSWDLWPYGVELQKNIQDNRWNFFVRSRQDMIGLDAQILMNPKVWEASGHVGGFSDPLVDCKKCHVRYRADQLIEEAIVKQDLKLDVVQEKIGVESMTPEAWTFQEQSAFLHTFKVKCPKCGACDWTEPKSFNLMFKTEQGTIEGSWKDIYLRPETAQGIFVNFKNVIDTMRVRVPFGIAQIGKAFRNEITPGNFMYRVREFNQMEIEFFCENDEKVGMKRFEYWKAESKRWREEEIWIDPQKLTFRDHEADELSFYSKGTCDVEYLFPRGWGELQGIAYRTDYDLTQHIQHSGKDLQYSDPVTGKRYVPHVVEPSWGLTRAVLTAMIDAYQEEKYLDQNGQEAVRTVAKFHKNIAPVKFAILPLIKKDEKQVATAENIFRDLSNLFKCEYDDGGAIGKRYRRQDEIWTPYCITVDPETVDENSPNFWMVTVRERDSMEQKRVKIGEIVNFMQ